jgi:hypothetical protein
MPRPSFTEPTICNASNFHYTQRRIFDLGAPSDVLNALRALAEGFLGEVKWRVGWL